MFSLPRTLPRASRSSICAQCLRQLHTRHTFPQTSLRTAPSIHLSTRPSLAGPTLLTCPPPNKLQSRNYAEKSSADDLIEEIQEQYATARDEFEIATEETEKKSVYAADDRAAAREELDNLKEMFEEAVLGEDGEEVKRRIGQRIRELDQAVQALETSALNE